MKKTINRFLMVFVALMVSMAGYAEDIHVEIDGLEYALNPETKEATVYRMVAGNNATEIVLPGTIEYGSETYTLKNIWIMAFVNCSNLISVTIPNTVETLWDGAFSHCTSLTSIEIPESVKSIKGWCFSGCTNLKSVSISSSVEKIEEGAFKECSSLESITVAKGNQYYESIEGCNAIIDIAEHTLIAGCKNTVIPNSVTTIGNYAFSECQGLETLEIPESVETIGYNAFLNCTGLTSITFPNSLTYIGSSAFQGCTGLTTITFPASIWKIDFRAFYECTNLTTIFVLRRVGPSINSATFDSYYSYPKDVHVLKGYKGNFTIDDDWSRFNIIDDIDPETLTITTDINDIPTTQATEGNKIFSVSGKRLSKPVKGVNIVNGKKIVY